MRNHAAFDLAALARVIGECQDHQDFLRTLDTTLRPTIGHRYMSVLRIHPGEVIFTRLYSSAPAALASGGRKSIAAAPQMQALLSARCPLLVNGHDAVSRSFPDHQKIFELGCAAVLNVPALWLGRVVATLNLLGAADNFNESDAELAFLVAQLALPALTSTS